MTVFVKQSTATTVVLGPFVDDTDGKTAETGLTISQSDVLLWKQGGTGFSAKNESTAATHRSNGCYTVPLDATDTNTLGQLIVSVNESGALPVRHDLQVVTANVWDSLFSTDKLQVDAVELDSSTAAAGKLRRSASGIVNGTVDDSAVTPSTTEFASDITESTDDHYIGRPVLFLTGNLAYQATVITDYDGTTNTFTVTALTEAPANGDTFVIC